MEKIMGYRIETNLRFDIWMEENFKKEWEKYLKAKEKNWKLSYWKYFEKRYPDIMNQYETDKASGKSNVALGFFWEDK